MRKNGAFAAKVAYFTIVVTSSISLPNLVPIGLKLSKLRPFEVVVGLLPSLAFEPTTPGLPHDVYFA